MATDINLPVTDVAILSRLVFPEGDQFPIEAAEAVLAIRSESADLSRIHDLLLKSQEDRLLPVERVEMENYRRISSLLDLMHSKARFALKSQQASP